MRLRLTTHLAEESPVKRAGPILAGLVMCGLVICVAGGLAMAFELQSPAFSSGGEIPVKHTCDGPDRSPPLRWTEPPAKTNSFALIVDDPDAPVGTWVHWVLYGVGATVRELPEGLAAQNTVPGIGTQGVNDFRKIGYGGPCPPRGPAHRYFFKLYALDTELNLPPRKTKAEVLKALEGHVLAQAELMGRYKRR
ncbi:MAG: YbhB/YbcL family Raf kinase inhibitor-like protein [Candidatus Methylomirabilia bacterium]